LVQGSVLAGGRSGHSIDKLALAAQLRDGIDRGELVVHYQPKLPLNGETTDISRPIPAEECSRLLAEIERQWRPARSDQDPKRVQGPRRPIVHLDEFRQAVRAGRRNPDPATARTDNLL
jgi:hypothetical protein